MSWWALLVGGKGTFYLAIVLSLLSVRKYTLYNDKVSMASFITIWQG